MKIAAIHEKIYVHFTNLNKTIYQNLLAQIQQKENFQNALLLVAALISGLVAVAYAKIFKLAEHLFLSSIAENKQIVFIMTPLLFLVAWWVVHQFSKESSGSGIPQVLAANEFDDEGQHKKQISRFLSFKIIFFKSLSSIISVIGGGAIGREGPTIHICASIFYIVGEKVKRYLPSSRSHLWIISGASAGLAAAFNTPLGGIIYAIEELGATHFSKIRTILLAAIITSGLISLWLSGNYLYLGFPVVTIEGISIIPMAILVGVISGLAGSSFSSLLFTLSSLRRKIKDPKKLALITLFCGFAMATLIYVDSRSSGSGLDLLNEFLFHGKTADGYLVLSRFFGTMISYLSGSAGGIFSPALTIGGSLGGYIAKLFASPDQNIIILLGMIGFLTGVTKTPFTSFILVVEMTNKHSAIFPMMVTALVALLASNIIHGHSFYERVKELYLEEIKTEKITKPKME